MRDKSNELEEHGVVILGASFDSVEDNKKFAEEQSFEYRLLSDPQKKVGMLYDVLRSPGEPFEDFPKRISYLIGPDGIIRKSYEVEDPGGHAAQVLDDLTVLLG